MMFNKFHLFLFLLLLSIKNVIVFSSEIKILAFVDNIIITNEDLGKEKIILQYLFDNKINEKSLNSIALDNLIEENIKKLEIKKNNLLISDIESIKFLKLILNKNNKSFEDFRKKMNNSIYENHLKNKIQIEMSWNKLISYKFSNLININSDEIFAKISKNQLDTIKYNDLILDEKNKKLQSLSQTYFNEIKNKTLIKYQ